MARDSAAFRRKLLDFAMVPAGPYPPNSPCSKWKQAPREALSSMTSPGTGCAWAETPLCGSLPNSSEIGIFPCHSSQTPVRGLSNSRGPSCRTNYTTRRPDAEKETDRGSGCHRSSCGGTQPPSRTIIHSGHGPTGVPHGTPRGKPQPFPSTTTGGSGDFNQVLIRIPDIDRSSGPDAPVRTNGPSILSIPHPTNQPITSSNARRRSNKDPPIPAPDAARAAPTHCPPHAG